MRTTLLPLFFILFSVLQTHAQIRFGNPQFFSISDGLPGPHIEDFVEDQYGFIWIATRSGLCRFDGSKISIIQKSDKDSSFLNSNHIRKLFLVGDTLWIGTAKGLTIMNIKTRTFQNHRFVPDFPGLNEIQRDDDVVRDIFRDKNGDTWLAPGFNGIVKFDKAKNKFVRYPLEKSQELPKVLGLPYHLTLYKIAQDLLQDSIIWGITGADLVKFNKNTGKYQRIRFKHENSEIEHRLNRFRSMYHHTDGKVYMGTWGWGMVVYDPANESFFAPAIHSNGKSDNEINNNGVINFYPKNDKEIYVTLGTGLYLFNVENNSWKLVKQNDLKATKELSYGVEFIDSKQRVWNGIAQGFFIYDPLITQYEYHSLSALNETRLKNLPRDMITDFYPGYVSIASQFSDGIYHINPTTGDKFKTPVAEDFLNQKTYFSSWGIARLSDDELLMNTNSKLFYYKKGMDEIVPYKWQPENQFSTFSHLAIDHKKRAWVGSKRDGLWLIDTKTGETGELSLPVSVSAHSNFIDSEGNIWLKINGGHAVYDEKKDSIFTFLYKDDSTRTMSNNHHFCQCPNGEVWVAGYHEGLGLLSAEHPEKGISKKIKLNNGKTDLSAIKVACDSKNNLWIMNYEQIIKLDRTTWKATDFSFDYGIKNIGFVFDFTNDDQLVIGARDGIYFVDPNTLRKNQEIPKPYILNIKTNKNVNYSTEELLAQETIFLASDENTISIEFSAINHTLADAVKYQYILEGVDADWTDPGKNRSLIYSNLKGGNYTFKLKACNNEIIWSENPYKLKINVGTPWYQTIGFYLTLLLLFAALVFVFYKFRIGQIKKESRIKTEFEKRIATVEMSALRAQMNPHFIFNCLNSIENYIIKNDTRKASEYLNNFGRLVRLILNNSRSNYVNLKDELEALELYIKMEQMRLRDSFQYEIEIEDGLIPENYEIPPMLIQPFIENSIWHGLVNRDGNGKVKLNISNGQNAICCTIEDNGIGREAAGKINASKKIKRKSMGMSITSERIEIINKLYTTENKVEIIDLYNDKKTPSGTKVIIKIPL